MIIRYGTNRFFNLDNVATVIQITATDVWTLKITFSSPQDYITLTGAEMDEVLEQMDAIVNAHKMAIEAQHERDYAYINSQR